MIHPQGAAGCLMRSLLLVCSALVVAAQPGFTSVNCGGEVGSDFVSQQTGISWKADGRFITTGFHGQVDASRFPIALPPELRTLRYFAAGSSPNKNCYVLPVVLGSTYLIRVGFFYGNYDLRRASSVQFKVSVDATLWKDLQISGASTTPVYLEVITAPAVDTTVSVCFIRTTLDAPFVNSLELRTLPSPSRYTGGMDNRRVHLHLLSRINFGEPVATYRHPEDPFDRIWSPYLQVVPYLQSLVTDIAAPPGQPIENPPALSDGPPEVVMRTAVTASVISYTRPIGVPDGSVIFMYQMFAELNATADTRIMDYSSPFEPGQREISLTSNSTRPFQTYLWGYSNATLKDGAAVTVEIVKNVSSNLYPLVNADELYTVHGESPGTHPTEVLALRDLKDQWKQVQWVGDPCEPVPWEELTCAPDNSSGTSRVTTLDLSGGKLSGDLPFIIASFTSLVSLNMRENALTGQLPSSFAALAALEVLDVSSNMLSGILPLWLQQLPSLKQLDISNNSFSGSIPPSLVQRLGSNFKYDGNLQLQCEDVSGCFSFPSPVPSPVEGVTPSAHPEALVAHKDRTMTIPTVAGAVSLAIFLILLAMGLYYCRKARGKRARTSDLTHISLRRAYAPKSIHDVTDQRHGSIRRLKVFSANVVKEATKNFSRKIGEGSLGPVYYGLIGNRREVAVKVLTGTSSQGIQEFIHEIELLPVVRHKNLVPVLGYCYRGTEVILVYEYMAGGDLKNRLYGRDAAANPLDWKLRLEIARGAAEGLNHLHHGCRPGIIHGDVKSSNILLTHKMEAKLADFGLSKRTAGEVEQGSPFSQGTTGYLDPQYYRSGTLTDKSDVYSFGIVLMELLCGRPPILLDGPTVPPHQRGIVEFMRTGLQTGDVGSFLDSSLGTEYSSEAAFKVAELAMSCVSMNHKSRPGMREVLRRIMLAIQLEESEMQRRAEASPYKYPETYPISHNWHTRRPSAASDSGV